jgi:hypothetical protein
MFTTTSTKAAISRETKQCLPGNKVLVLESDELRRSSSIEECLHETKFLETEPENLYEN